MVYRIKIEPEAKDDIQDAIKWYNKKVVGLGKLFHEDVKARMSTLKVNPHFQVRYRNVRCLPLHKFPFMIHFAVNDDAKMVIVRAVFHMHLSPKIWSRR